MPVTAARRLGAAARRLGLRRRIDARFRERGWALDERRVGVLAALVCVAAGAGRTELRLAARPEDEPCWVAITDRPSWAIEVVRWLGLLDLLRERAQGVDLSLR